MYLYAKVSSSDLHFFMRFKGVDLFISYDLYFEYFDAECDEWKSEMKKPFAIFSV